MSKLKLCTSNMCSLLFVHYTSVKLFKKQKLRRKANLMYWPAKEKFSEHYLKPRFFETLGKKREGIYGNY